MTPMKVDGMLKSLKVTQASCGYFALMHSAAQIIFHILLSLTPSVLLNILMNCTSCGYSGLMSFILHFSTHINVNVTSSSPVHINILDIL